MKLPFLDRQEELDRLRNLFARKDVSLGVVCGRRRCGKSRLIHEALPRGRFDHARRKANRRVRIAEEEIRREFADWKPSRGIYRQSR